MPDVALSFLQGKTDRKGWSDQVQDAALQAIGAIRSAQGGAQELVKHASDQSDYWCHIEKRFRAGAIAAQTYSGELQASLEALKENTEGACQAALKKLPVWLDNLDVCVLTPVLTALRSNLDQSMQAFLLEMAKGEQTDEQKKAQDLMDLMQRAVDILSTRAEAKPFELLLSGAKAATTKTKSSRLERSLESIVKSLCSQDQYPTA